MTTRSYEPKSAEEISVAQWVSLWTKSNTGAMGSLHDRVYSSLEIFKVSGSGAVRPDARNVRPLHRLGCDLGFTHGVPDFDPFSVSKHSEWLDVETENVIIT